MDVLNNVIVFYGPYKGVGVSMVATSVTKRLHRLTNKHILYVSMDGTKGGEYLAESDNTLDQVKNNLMANCIQPHELLDICQRIKPRLFFLPGAQDYLARRQYHPEPITKLLDTLSKQFDLIIVDAGNELDLGLSIGAMMSSPYHYMVTTQQHKVLAMYKAYESLIKSLNAKAKDSVILNKYLDDNQLISQEQAKGFYENLLCTIPYTDIVQGFICEGTHTTLSESSFDKGIKSIVEDIEQKLQWDLLEEKENQTGVKGFLSGLLKGGRKNVDANSTL